MTEPLSQLKVDARLWLECTDGRTRLVLLIKLDVVNKRTQLRKWKGTCSSSLPIFETFPWSTGR